MTLGPVDVPAPSVVVTSVRSVARTGHFRWYVCALLFFASTINYVDRQVISILKPDLQVLFGWSERDYGWIAMAFQAAYAIGFMGAGRVMDRLGVRLGLSIAIVLWSLAAMAHAGALVFGPSAAVVLSSLGLTAGASVAGFIVARLALGLGESGNFPAAIKTVAEWFPRRERALATGIFNAGTNVGALVAPLAVPWLAVAFGWQAAFLATGVLGFAWLLAWWAIYRSPAEHPRVTRGELTYIQSDAEPVVAPTPWREVVQQRQAWVFAVGKFMTDPVWWLYLFWIPDFLNRNYGLTLTAVGPPLVAIYLLADVGSIGGGWLSSRLIGRGWTVNRARKTAMLVCALAVTPIVFASMVHNLWAAVLLVGLAAAAHQGWSANLFTLTSDMFPRPAVGSVVGFGGMTGAVGGMLIAKVTATILQATGSYVPVFIVAASAYLAALLVIHILVPRLEPARLER
jgi:MFS transporter, ACS family, aldohexuronate transporter